MVLVATITAEPAPIIVTSPVAEFTLATLVFLLSYVTVLALGLFSGFVTVSVICALTTALSKYMGFCAASLPDFMSM